MLAPPDDSNRPEPLSAPSEDRSLPSEDRSPESATPRDQSRLRAELSRGVALLRGAGPEYPVGLSLIAFSIAAPVFIRLSAPGARSDIAAHAAVAARMVKDGGWISYTLWYPLIYLTSSGSSDPKLLRELSVGFLLIAVVAKTLLVYYFSWVSTRHRTASAIIAMLMLVAMPIINPWNSHAIYSGQISANVWHNSTQIFALPFSVAAFIAAVALLRVQTMPRAALLGITILASTLAKPNYTLALLPALGLMLLWTLLRAKTQAPRVLAMLCLVSLPSMLLLAYQYLVVYGQSGTASTVLSFAPFATWTLFTDNIPLSILRSVAGPLAVLLLLPRKARTDPALVLSWMVLGVALVQLASFAERLVNGPIATAGDFFWGTFSAVFMVFVASAIALARTYLAGPHSSGRRVALFAAVMIMTVHAATGLYYLGRAGEGGFPVWRYR